MLDDAALRRRHAVAERKGHACARLSRYLRSTMHGRVRRAWTELKINAERGRSLLQQDAFLAHQRRHALRRCVSYLRSGSKAMAFRAWLVNADLLRTKTVTLRRVLGRWTKRVQYEAFEVLARARRDRPVLSRILQKMLRLKALTAFTWTTHVQRRLTSHRSLLSRARALHRCARLVKGGRLSLYFRAWAKNIRRLMNTEAACRRIQRATTRYERATRLRYVRRWVQQMRADISALHDLEEVPRPLRAPGHWSSGGDVVGRRFSIKKTGGPPRARHGTVVARVGDKCHLEVEVHGADHGKVERCVPKVTKAAGRGFKAAEARPRRPDDQGRR